MGYYTQLQLYFNTIHDIRGMERGGLFQFAPQNHLQLFYNEKPEKCVSKINSLLNKYRCNSIYCSLNYFKPISNKTNLRRAANLWGIDCIMIDIDGTKELCGMEQEVYRVLKWAWEHKKIPQPNLISVTGGGGLHLYYAFEYLPASMKASVQALKWSIVSLLVPFERDFPYKEDFKFHIDTKVMDPQRLDRVPGSVNPKTGNKCYCFATGKERYTYKELLNLVSPDETYSSRIAIEQFKRDINYFRRCKQDSKKRKKNYKTVLSPQKLAESRLNKIMLLVKNGKKFENCREMVCFFVRTWCKQLNKTEQEEKQILLYLNDCFYEPLTERELFKATKPNKEYHFSNSYLFSSLFLTEDETRIFCPNYRPGNRKQKTTEHKMKISLLVQKGFKIKEIAKMLHLSESIVKRRRTEIKKGEGFSYWVKKFKSLYSFKKIKKVSKKHGSFFSNQKSSFCKYISNSLYSCKKVLKRKRQSFPSFFQLRFIPSFV